MDITILCDSCSSKITNYDECYCSSCYAELINLVDDLEKENEGLRETIKELEEEINKLNENN